MQKGEVLVVLLHSSAVISPVCGLLSHANFMVTPTSTHTPVGAFVHSESPCL